MCYNFYMFIICSSGLIINSKNQFLMLQRTGNDIFLPGYWELPGGRIEMGEEPADALLREVKEESGLDIKIINPLKVVSYYKDPINPRESYGIFYFCKLKDENQQVTVSHEHSDYKWISFNNTSDIQINDFLKNLIKEFKISPVLQIAKE